MTLFRNLSLLSIALMAPSAWGAIVYVDATPNTSVGVGNTTIDGALVVFPINATQVNGANATTGGDGFWNYRPDAAAGGGNYWETDTTNATAETTAPLITSVQLGPGTYNLYGVFRPQAATHDVSFSLNGVTYSEFTTGNATAAVGDGSDFVNPGDVGTIDHSIGDVYLASLGQVTLAASQLVSIYAQGPDLQVGGSNSGQRTRYEGIGYEQVETIPEPSSVLLITFAVMGFATCYSPQRSGHTGS